jgi:hypothetical protein
MPPLNEAETSALREALDDEYRAWVAYDQVIRDFGAARPFINIREAEARHIAAQQALFVRYGLAVPGNSWAVRVPHFGSLRKAKACATGADAEGENDRLYAWLFSATQRPDLVAVLRNLQEASQQRHLPAFRLCAERR